MEEVAARPHRQLAAARAGRGVATSPALLALHDRAAIHGPPRGAQCARAGRERLSDDDRAGGVAPGTAALRARMDLSAPEWPGARPRLHHCAGKVVCLHDRPCTTTDA